jgi:hypothetical protein
MSSAASTRAAPLRRESPRTYSNVSLVSPGIQVPRKVLPDSNSYRSFCRLGIEQRSLKKSTLQKNIKAVKAETWWTINRELALYAAADGIEMGEKVRTDCIVVESNIHHPTDSSLLWDCVRVLVRLMSEAKEDFGLNFTDHSRRAKRRALGILNAKSNDQRVPLYRDLLKVTGKTVRNAVSIAGERRHPPAREGDREGPAHRGTLPAATRSSILAFARACSASTRAACAAIASRRTRSTLARSPSPSS